MTNFDYIKNNRQEFLKIVDKFILHHGIEPVVIAKSMGNVNNKCLISLRGGYSTTIELIDDMIYKDGEFYCNLEQLIK